MMTVPSLNSKLARWLYSGGGLSDVRSFADGMGTPMKRLNVVIALKMRLVRFVMRRYGVRARLRLRDGVDDCVSLPSLVWERVRRWRKDMCAVGGQEVAGR